MKKTKIILVITILFFSCNKNKEYNEIICNIENSEGFELVYSVEGEDFKNRQVQKVKNGKVIFKSSKNNIEMGYIESLYNLDKFDNQRRWIRILPENETINLNFEIIKDSIEIDYNVFAPIYNLENIVFNGSSNNKEFHNYLDEKYDNYLKGISYSNSKKDSLNKYVFPNIKRKLLNLYDEKYQKSDNEILKVVILSDMLNHWVFDSYEHFTEEEKTRVNSFVNKIEVNQKSTSFYKLQERVNEVNKIDRNNIEFTDFSLEDSEGEKHKLSKFIKNNNFTVLYFWTSSCGPCRSFNRKLKTKNKNLTNNGIEIVSINVDLQRKYWKDATIKDSIFWTNLYAGKNLELHKKYNIRWWPTKIIFNKKKELIDFEFINPEDLLKLVN